jgi:DNA-binding NarL/FixJ family response regulator
MLGEASTTTIMLVDDHDVVRRGLRGLLEGQGLQVVAEAADGISAVDAADAAQPDIVIVDYSLPGMNGAEVTRQVREHLPDVEVLIFTMHEEEEILRDSLDAGAIGFLLKSEDARELLAAVEALGRHQPYFSARVNQKLLHSFLSPARQKPDRSVLSARERQVVTLIAEGKSGREAAEILHISAKTAETHRAAAKRKLGVRTAADLTRYAVKNKLIQL